MLRRANEVQKIKDTEKNGGEGKERVTRHDLVVEWCKRATVRMCILRVEGEIEEAP